MKSPQEYYHGELERLHQFLRTSKSRSVVVSEQKQNLAGKYDIIILDNLVGRLIDIQLYLSKLHRYCESQTRLVVTYYNHFWEPILNLATALGWRQSVPNQNWLDNQEIANLLSLAGFEVITEQKRFLFPLDFPIVSEILNKWLAHFPLINELCLITWVVARPKKQVRRNYSVSIVVPARNEEGNIDLLIKNLPKFGRWRELIFVEGHSKDQTWKKIVAATEKSSSSLRITGYKQKGIGKADAVRLGFEKARGELLMILDADLTVSPHELTKFYKVIADGEGEFVHGGRLVYPMERDAMRSLNRMGNKIFSILFTWILGQRFKDTLCGTKVLLKRDYQRIIVGRRFFGDFDPFGDFDLIFGAVKQNLKVVEIPIRYRERIYGSTNISRFQHGWLLLKMTWFAFRRFKAW